MIKYALSNYIIIILPGAVRTTCYYPWG